MKNPFLYEKIMIKPLHNDIMALRHSAAHLLAHAVMELYPNTLLTIGPATQEGFFYDLLPKKNFKEEDLAAHRSAHERDCQSQSAAYA